jgi:dephospho-CoA kinase
MKEVQVIAFVGMPGVGKSSCVSYLEQQGISSVYFGGIVVDEVKARGMDVNEVNEKFVREDLRAKEGPSVLATRIIKKIEALASKGHDKVIADGLYSWTEYKAFKERFGDHVTIIAIAAPRHVRHQRLAHRPIRPLTDEEVTAREYAEIENIEKGGPIANADFTLVNGGTAKDMLTDLDQLLKTINFI